MGGLHLRSPQVTARFVSALGFELALLVVLAGAAGLIVWWRHRRAPVVELPAEPSWRRTLRIGFGLLWIAAGLLQLQPAMPIGLSEAVLRPSVEHAPGWLADLVNAAADAWLRHPILGATGVVWIELGLGVALLAARSGRSSRAAGLASAAWAAVVYVSSGIGGLFVAPFAFAFGAPGASLLYLAAGLAIAAAPAQGAKRSWQRRSSVILGGGLLVMLATQVVGSGAFFESGEASSYSSMAGEMAGLAQPAPAAAIERWFASAAMSFGPVLNILVVLVLAATALALLLGSAAALRRIRWAFLAMALLLWLLVQDLGIAGGTATDLNSMPAWILLVFAASQALDGARDERPPSVESPARLPIAAGAAVSVLLGVVLLGGLVVLPGASGDLALAKSGGVRSLSGPAPNFELQDQHGHPVSMTSLAGKVVVLFFVDPVCSSECPIQAQELRIAAKRLGDPEDLAFVAINANPHYSSVADSRAFIEAEGLAGWHQLSFLTGSRSQLRRVWSDYGVTVTRIGPGGMELHSEPIYLIAPDGSLRATWPLGSGDGPGSVEGQSSIAEVVAQARAAR